MGGVGGHGVVGGGGLGLGGSLFAGATTTEDHDDGDCQTGRKGTHSHPPAADYTEPVEETRSNGLGNRLRAEGLKPIPELMFGIEGTKPSTVRRVWIP